MQNFTSLALFTFKRTYQEIFWFCSIYIVFITLQRFLLLHQNNSAAVFFNDIFFLYIVIFLLYGNLAKKINTDGAFEWLKSMNISSNQMIMALDACLFTLALLPLCILICAIHTIVEENIISLNLFCLIFMLGLNFLAISHLLQGPRNETSYLKFIAIPIPILIPSLIFAQIHYESPSNITICYTLGTTMISLGALILKSANVQE